MVLEGELVFHPCAVLGDRARSPFLAYFRAVEVSCSVLFHRRFFVLVSRASVPPFLFQKLIKNWFNLWMSFILARFCQLVDVLIAVLWDVLLKELLNQALIFGLPFFFLPAQLPKVARARTAARVHIHETHTLRTKVRMRKAIKDATNAHRAHVTSFFSSSSNFSFMATPLINRDEPAITIPLWGPQTRPLP